MTDIIDDFVTKFHEDMHEDSFGKIFCRRLSERRYMGAMRNANIFTLKKGSCGDSMLIYFRFENGIVQDASFQTDGCAPSVVCGSYAAELCIGKSPEALFDISAETIISQFGALPEKVRHCAELAAGTVHAAADKCMRELVAAERREAD